MNTRRELFLRTIAAAVGSQALFSGGSAGAVQADETEGNTKSRLPGKMFGTESVAILLYPGFTALDVFGPHHFLSSLMGASVRLVAETTDAVRSDTGVSVSPQQTFAECPEKLTVLLVPGGTTGTLAAARNPAVLSFLRSRGEQADWVCSVCTGSLILGAAGLLKGFQATSHWLVREQLTLFGATPVDQRVVMDRNRITGAGVTAGLDFGLSLVQQLRGQGYAEGVQLMSEYAPRPPLNAGCEQSAPPEIAALLKSTHLQFNALVQELANATEAE